MEINGNGHDDVQKPGFTPNGVHISTFPKHRRGVHNALTQLVQMQRVLHGQTMNDKNRPHDRASCARVWAQLEEQRQILLGRGKPKPVEARNNQVRRKARTAPAWADPDLRPAEVSSCVTPQEPPSVTEPPKP